MGVVDVPKLLATGALPEIEKWGTERVRVNDYATPYVGNVAVASEYRRRGIASKLVAEAERHAKHTWKIPRICLHVEEGNEPAKEMYAALGYRCELREPEWYKNIGRPCRLFLRKDLSAATRKSKVVDWDSAPVKHTKKLNIVEYLAWCYYDLRQTAKSKA